MVVEAVLFDYGGTLIENNKPWAEVKPAAILSAYRTMKRVGLKLPFEQCKELNDSVFQKTEALELAENRTYLTSARIRRSSMTCSP